MPQKQQLKNKFPAVLVPCTRSGAYGPLLLPVILLLMLSCCGIDCSSSPAPAPESGTQGQAIASPARYLALADRLYQKPGPEQLQAALPPDAAPAFQNALAAWEGADYPAVLNALQSIPGHNPAYVPALYMKAHAHYQLRQYAAAAEYFTAVSDLKIAPYAEAADAYLLLSLLAQGQAQTSKFQAHLRQVLSTPAHTRRALALDIQQKL